MADFSSSNFHDINTYLDLPSPAESLDLYGDGEPSAGASASESQSPIGSPYGLSFIPDLNLAGLLPSPVTSPSTNAVPEAETPAEEEKKPTKKPAAKRKRENRYKNAPPAVLSRRRAQNRASQRAYRERKDQRIKDLEAMLEEAKKRNETLSQALNALQADYTRLTKTRTGQRSHSQLQMSMPYDMDMSALMNGGVVVNGGMDMFAYQANNMAGFPM